MSEQVPGDENERSPARAGNRTRSSVAKMSEVIKRIDVSNSLTVPLRHAIDDLLQLAAGSVGSAVASLLVGDGNEGGLKFLTATSGVLDELLGSRRPTSAGIDGLGFSTPHP